MNAPPVNAFPLAYPQAVNAPADCCGFKTNKMFISTQAGSHDALHYGNLVTYLRLNGLAPSGSWF